MFDLFLPNIIADDFNGKVSDQETHFGTTEDYSLQDERNDSIEVLVEYQVPVCFIKFRMFFSKQMTYYWLISLRYWYYMLKAYAMRISSRGKFDIV